MIMQYYHNYIIFVDYIYMYNRGIYTSQLLRNIWSPYSRKVSDGANFHILFGMSVTYITKHNQRASLEQANLHWLIKSLDMYRVTHAQIQRIYLPFTVHSKTMCLRNPYQLAVIIIYYSIVPRLQLWGYVSFHSKNYSTYGHRSHFKYNSTLTTSNLHAVTLDYTLSK